MTQRVNTAMVLAAGLGTRMRPLTDDIPKPIVRLAGRALIDHVLDRLGDAGIGRAVVNVHYHAGKLEALLAERSWPAITISDERGVLLDTGGGVRKALPLLGVQPFLIHNSDSVWIETGEAAIPGLLDAWDSERMDSLMLLARRDTSLGYDGKGDFDLAADGRLSRRAGDSEAAYVFTGVSIAHPQLMRDTPQGAFSLNTVWDRAIADGRLFGTVLDGTWMHVGTPEALRDAETLMARMSISA